MTRRLMVVEPDASGRAMLDRVLTAAGYTAEDFESAHHARLVLDDDAFDLAVVDELAGEGAPLDEVRFLRAEYPRLPLIVSGTLLTTAVLLELRRLGVSEALPKPFTPSAHLEVIASSLSANPPSIGHYPIGLARCSELLVCRSIPLFRPIKQIISPATAKQDLPSAATKNRR